MNRAMKSAIMIKEGAPGLGGRVATNQYEGDQEHDEHKGDKKRDQQEGDQGRRKYANKSARRPRTRQQVECSNNNMKMQGEMLPKRTAATHCCCRHGCVALALGPNHISSRILPTRLTLGVTYRSHVLRVYNCLRDIVLLTSN